jgi:hypothetical protein
MYIIDKIKRWWCGDKKHMLGHDIFEKDLKKEIKESHKIIDKMYGKRRVYKKN